MYFKIGLLLGAAFSLIHCAKIKQSPGAPIVIETSSDSACFSDLGLRMKAYLNGSMDEKDVRAFWNCAAKNLGTYRHFTRGDLPGGAYSASALRIFIENYFLPNGRLSDESLKGFMGIKRVLLGGDEATVTLGEFESLEKLIRTMESLSLDLRPHMGILTEQRRASSEEIDQATAAAAKALNDFAAVLSAQNQDYAFRDLEQFLAAFKQDTVDAIGIYARLERVLKLVPPIKTILINGPRDRIAGGEWKALFEGSGKVVRAWTYLAHSVQGGDPESALTSPLMPQTGLEIADALNFAFARRPDNPEITLEELRPILAVVVDSPTWPQSITAQGVLNLGSWALKRLLGGDGTKIDANVSAQWQGRMHRWQEMLAGAPDPKFEALWKEAPLPVWDELGRITWGQAGEEKATRSHRVWSYLAMNWLYEVYQATDAATGPQLDGAVAEILPLLQDLGWLERTKLSIGRKLLHEADLFTAAGNGDGKLQLGESVRFLNMIVSSLRAAQVWTYDAPACHPNGSGDCFAQAALRGAGEILAPMSTWPRELFARQNFVPYFQRAGQIALNKNIAEANLGLGDLLQSWLLFSYIEVFFDRFDADRSQGISISEAIPAMKIFGSTIFDLLFGWNSSKSFSYPQAQIPESESTLKRPQMKLEASRQNLMHLIETFADL